LDESKGIPPVENLLQCTLLSTGQPAKPGSSGKWHKQF